MNLVLLTLVVVSLAAAAGFGVVAWRMLVEQRRRSGARVAALASTLDGAPVHSSPDAAPTLPASPGPAGGAAGIPRVDRATPVAVSSMFGTAPGGSVRGRPLIRAAVVVSMAIVLIVVAAMVNRSHPDSTPPGDAPPPLELVSMRHTRDGGTLTVTGLVRNPHAGAPQARIAAVVLAFDRDGSFLMSARAPLDFATLGPGDESPFVVTLAKVGDVGRYRVSFRTDEGVLRHVDRRATQVAAN